MFAAYADNSTDGGFLWDGMGKYGRIWEYIAANTYFTYAPIPSHIYRAEHRCLPHGTILYAMSSAYAGYGIHGRLREILGDLGRKFLAAYISRIRGLWRTWAADAAKYQVLSAGLPASHTLPYFPISIARHTGVRLTIPCRMPSPAGQSLCRYPITNFGRHEVSGGGLQRHQNTGAEQKHSTVGW